VKMAIFQVVAAILLFGIANCRHHYDGDKAIRINAKDLKQIDFVQKWIQSMDEKFDVWRQSSNLGVPIDIHIQRDDYAAAKATLESEGIPFHVLVEDLEKQVKEEEDEIRERNTYSNGYNYDNYNRFDTIMAEVRRLNSVHSDHTELVTVGTSYEGRSLVAIKIKGPHSNDANQKKAIWIDGCIHAREWLATATVMFLLKQLLEPEAQFQSSVQQLLSRYDVYVMPVFNADGYEYSHTRQRMWRKTRTPGSRCYGADPNRNWDSAFGGVGTSPNECTDIYHGKYAFSEPCTRAVSNYLAQVASSQGLKSYWGVHCYSQLVLFPWGYTTRRAPDYREIKRVADIFAGGIASQSGKRFITGQPGEILYSAAGGSIDWVHDKLRVTYAYGPELRPDRHYWGNGFIYPARYIRPSGMEFTNGWLKAMLAMH